MKINKIFLLIIIALVIIVVVILFNYVNSKTSKDDDGNNKEKPVFHITGEYVCDSDYHKYDPFIEHPEYIPIINFYDDYYCILRVNYIGGIADVKCNYEIKDNNIQVKLNLDNTPFYGTDKWGHKYMDDKYTFDIINDNHIVINNGFYTVDAGDSFIKK